ncbi:hypothetical protein evm_012399 [Chilo suppressalis]|nr:hypothetical protein evm_012399 [Chilo suppressalis]
MYVLAVLCMVKLYQSRHADVNAGAHATFMAIAALMAIGLCGILYANVYFWAAFTALHLTTCLWLTLKIYYVGQFTIERGVFHRGWSAVRGHGWRVLAPSYTTRAVLLALANLANWALAIYGMYEHNKDFARHLLAILMGNAFLYTCFYVVMKLVHHERIPFHAAIYLITAIGSWTTAIVYFLDARTKWSETPAQSRQHNAQCSVLQFYDSHDVWHLASAAAVFLYLNALRTIDDCLAHTPRNLIPVF